MHLCKGSLKPIFHCDAKLLASGVTPKYTNMVYFGVTPDAKPKIWVTPMPTPDASQWNIGGVGSSGVGHVYFMYISCCLCIIFRVGSARISRRKPSFQWNMGFRTFSSFSHFGHFAEIFLIMDDLGGILSRLGSKGLRNTW